MNIEARAASHASQHGEPCESTCELTALNECLHLKLLDRQLDELKMRFLALNLRRKFESSVYASQWDDVHRASTNKYKMPR